MMTRPDDPSERCEGPACATASPCSPPTSRSASSSSPAPWRSGASTRCGCPSTPTSRPPARPRTRAAKAWPTSTSGRSTPSWRWRPPRPPPPRCGWGPASCCPPSATPSSPPRPSPPSTTCRADGWPLASDSAGTRTRWPTTASTTGAAGRSPASTYWPCRRSGTTRRRASTATSCASHRRAPRPRPLRPPGGRAPGPLRHRHGRADRAALDQVAERRWGSFPMPPPRAQTGMVTDKQDHERLLDDYRALNDPERRRAVERRGGYFVVEGRLALEALLESPYPLRSVLVSEPRSEAVAALVGDRAPVVVRPADELAATTGFAFHRGVLAAADRIRQPQLRDLVAHARTVCVLEGVNDHENLGALFRNAAAFGVDAVFLDPTTADPLYRRSVRVSLGHVLRMPWARLDALPAGLDALRVQGFAIVALTPNTRAEPIDVLAHEIAARTAASATIPVRLALVVGAEGPGLSAASLAAADHRVRIPIAAGVDSLNVATAAAIAFHTVYESSGRGRGGRGS